MLLGGDVLSPLALFKGIPSVQPGLAQDGAEQLSEFIVAIKNNP